MNMHPATQARKRAEGELRKLINDYAEARGPAIERKRDEIDNAIQRLVEKATEEGLSASIVEADGLAVTVALVATEDGPLLTLEPSEGTRLEGEMPGEYYLRPDSDHEGRMMTDPDFAASEVARAREGGR